MDITLLNPNELSESLFDFNNIIHHLPHAIFWKDTQSRYLGCNKLFAEIAGLKSPSEVIGKSDFDLPWSKEESDSYRADDIAIMASGMPKLNYEEYQTQKNGNQRAVLASKVPIRDTNNRVIGILGIYTDITERKILEESLFQAKLAAESANKLKVEFIHNMEHDIRTPFSGIYGIAKMLADTETDAKKKDFLNDISSCAKELLAYSTGLLDFSFIESGTLPLVSKKFNLKQLVDGLIAMETPPSKIKGLEFTARCEEDVPLAVMGDRYRLQRILINLISNAIKFTQKGHINLIIQKDKMVDAKTIRLTFIIQDTGIGIPKDKISVFEKTTDLLSTEQKYQGLGLRLVKQFIDEMEAEIKVTSVANKGTTFECTFPFKLP